MSVFGQLSSIYTEDRDNIEKAIVYSAIVSECETDQAIGNVAIAIEICVAHKFVD